MAKDFFHECVRIALETDGWQITHDPYNLTTVRRDGKKVGIPIDLGAERVFAAEKGGEKIAIEVKSFLRASVVNEFHRAMGQYLMYQIGLNGQESDRVLYLAIHPIPKFSLLFTPHIKNSLHHENTLHLLFAFCLFHAFKRPGPQPIPLAYPGQKH